jgi:hypothetical protein
MSGYVGLSRLKKQKPEATGLSGAVRVLGMESDARVVGLGAPIASSGMVNALQQCGKMDTSCNTAAKACFCLLVSRTVRVDTP